jgi:hypothetical protein
MPSNTAKQGRTLDSGRDRADKHWSTVTFHVDHMFSSPKGSTIPRETYPGDVPSPSPGYVLPGDITQGRTLGEVRVKV